MTPLAVGAKYGRRTVEAVLAVDLYDVRCDCGTMQIVHGRQLTGRNAGQSCGCLSKERTVEYLAAFDADPVKVIAEKKAKRAAEQAKRAAEQAKRAARLAKFPKKPSAKGAP